MCSSALCACGRLRTNHASPARARCTHSTVHHAQRTIKGSFVCLFIYLFPFTAVAPSTTWNHLQALLAHYEKPTPPHLQILFKTNHRHTLPAPSGLAAVSLYITFASSPERLHTCGSFLSSVAGSTPAGALCPSDCWLCSYVCNCLSSEC